MRTDFFAAADGHAVIVAMDHGLTGGAVNGLETPLRTLDAVLLGEPDGVLVSPGMARHAQDRITRAGVALWVTLDYYGTSTIAGGDGTAEIHAVVSTPAVARDLGAAGVKAILVFGYEHPEAYAKNLHAVGALADQAHRIGLPLMVEAVLWGRTISPGQRDDAALIAHACRIAAELGADLIKTTLPSRGLRSIVDALPIPILILGGPPDEEPGAFLRRAGEAIREGARGVVAGRVVWQANEPAAVVAALRTIVHQGSAPSKQRGA
jgi:DhnA family fructose-bisphosphate aldolase class Ia